MTERIPCPIDGCEFTTGAPAGLGPHLAAHRRRGEATPKRKRSKTSSPRRPRPKSLQAADVADTVVEVLYPKGVPTARVREVAAWIAATERLVEHAQSPTESSPHHDRA